MTDKEIKRLSRADLIDIIYQLQKNEANLIKMNEELKERLASKEMKIENAGTIAEAAISVNNVFEKAQQAADIYLSELHRMNEDVEQRYKLRLEQAETEAAQIIEEAQKTAKAKIAAANNAILKYLVKHPEMRSVLAPKEDNNGK